MCLIKQRAKNPEQKALRRQQILDASRERFQTLSYEEVNLNHVAADVGITKAALYRYFRNKETLFLALFVQSLKELVKDFDKLEISSSDTVKDHPLAELICKTLLENPIYCKLSAILHTILERNLTLEEATLFKQELLNLMSNYAQLLSEHPEFKAQKDSNPAITILMQVQQALIGVWHMTHPSGAIAEVIEVAPLNIFKQDFGPALLAHINKIIHP